jgi:prefoldin subunit 5
MAQTFEQLIEKSPGQLIRSADWNDLVHGIIDLNAQLTDRLKQANEAIAALQETATTLRQEFTDYQNRVNPIIGQLYQVSIQTSQTAYAIGQLAEIEVRVSDPLEGRLVREDEAGRPWVDFIATWGQLKAAPGFESLAGEGDRAISVRVNEQGIAKALLSADHTTGFSREDENAVATTLATQALASGKAIAQVFLESETPVAVKQLGAFAQITEAYDRPDTEVMRRYADAYYIKNAPEIAGHVTPTRGTWRDYRATVLAVVKSDAAPGTPQRRHGVESILVSFRDWITPWVHLEYLDPARLRDPIDEARQRLMAKVGDDYLTTAVRLREEIEQSVANTTLIGKVREWRVLDQALDGLAVNNAPAFLPTLVEAVQQGVRMQQSLENAQASAVALPSQTVAFQVFTQAATRADTNVSGLAAQVGALQQQVEQAGQRLDTFGSSVGELRDSVGRFGQRFDDTLSDAGAIGSLRTRLESIQNEFATLDTSVNDLRTSFSTVNGRIDAALAEGGIVSALQNDVVTVKGQVAGLQNLNPSEVTTKLSEVVGLANRLSAIELKVG